MEHCFRYSYGKECKEDRELMAELAYFDRLSPSNADPKNINTTLPCVSVETRANVLSKDGTEWLHAVEADRDGENIKIRIITKDNRGVNVVISNARDRILYNKYRDLRFLIRNNDAVYVTFPQLKVMAIKNVRGLYLLAHDFKVKNPDINAADDTPYIDDEPDRPEPTLFI